MRRHAVAAERHRHALDDVAGSIETFAGEMSPEDLRQVRDGLAEWLANQGSKVKAPPEVRSMTLPVVEPYILSA